MSAASKKFYVTTPIYYVNARPHIGHAYTTIVADVLARRHRLLGEDTFFLTGTDEHGQKIERSAAAAGVPPQQFADKISAEFETLWRRMGITNDAYIRTTDLQHARGVQKLFSTLYERGFIELRDYTGAYCVSDETFVDAPAGTPCPDCGRLLETVTEENFFFKLSAFQEKLIDLISPGSDGTEPKLKIMPYSARNEILTFLQGNAANLDRQSKQKDNPELQKVTIEAIDQLLKTGVLKRSLSGVLFDANNLKDLSISRSSFTWGIAVPEDIQRKENAKHLHVIYVWLDALANYMTAIRYGSDKPEDEAQFRKFWPANLHLVGKEITRFHCVYWPAFLMAAGLPTPKAITAHGWLLFEESKMSKSKGNIVRTETILDAFGNLVYATIFPDSTHAEQDLFGTDVLRYFLFREIPFGQDGSFSFDAMITRYNADLANGYGNLVSRTLTMISKYCDGDVPPRLNRPTGELPTLAQEYFFNFMSGPGKMAYENEANKRNFRLRYSSGSLENGINNAYNYFDFTRIVENLAWAVSGTDGHLTSNAPWKMPEGADRNDVLYNAAESIRILTALLYPILPYATARVWAQLGLGDIELAAKNGELNNLQWGGLKPGTKLGPLAPIFPRADKGLAQIMTDMEEQNSQLKNSNLETGRNTPPSEAQPESAPPASSAPADASPQIAIDDFAKVELRIAQVLIAERIPKADKLLRLEVDLGYEKRQILSGIAEWYTPEELIGRRILIIANLASRKMRGLESHGMLLAASEEGGKPFLATVPEGVPLGTRLK